MQCDSTASHAACNINVLLRPSSCFSLFSLGHQYAHLLMDLFVFGPTGDAKRNSRGK